MPQSDSAARERAVQELIGVFREVPPVQLAEQLPLALD